MLKDIKKQLNSPDSYISMALGLAVVLIVGVLAFNYITKKDQSKLNSSESSTQTEEAKIMEKLPVSHVVKSGETLWSIAQNYYKSGYNWVDIVKANKLADANIITAGQKLTIPKVAPIVPKGQITEMAATETKPKTSEYTVQKGDNLWKIAVAQYNNGYRWVDIAKANNLANPGLIHPGNKFKLP